MMESIEKEPSLKAFEKHPLVVDQQNPRLHDVLFFIQSVWV
jgi:hypothetical protein